VKTLSIAPVKQLQFLSSKQMTRLPCNLLQDPGPWAPPPWNQNHTKSSKNNHLFPKPKCGRRRYHNMIQNLANETLFDHNTCKQT
jgi:hypothetical protein